VTAPQILMAGDTARTRFTDPLTSHQAADSNNIAESSAAVVRILREAGQFGLSDWEIEYEHRKADGLYTGARLRTARHELTDAGLVEDSGDTTLTPSGRRCKIWRLTTG
jgi:hypothetical protein